MSQKLLEAGFFTVNLNTLYRPIASPAAASEATDPAETPAEDTAAAENLPAAEAWEDW